jgi:hypothetical protein
MAPDVRSSSHSSLGLLRIANGLVYRVQTLVILLIKGPNSDVDSQESSNLLMDMPNYRIIKFTNIAACDVNLHETRKPLREK